jgi:hypothetical protein
MGPVHPAYRHKEGEKKEARNPLYLWWQVWKERNRRIFEHKEVSANNLANLTIEAVNLQGSVFYSYMN